jgi:hypothetical protein
MLLCRHSFYHFHDRNLGKKGGWIDWQKVWLICAGSSIFPVAPDFCLDIIPGRYTVSGKSHGDIGDRVELPQVDLQSQLDSIRHQSYLR